MPDKQDTKYLISGMDCANCALTLERSLGQLPGVEAVTVNFTAATLEARGSFDPQALLSRVEALGYHAAEAGTVEATLAALPGDEKPARSGLMEFLAYLWAAPHGRLDFAGAALLVAAALLGLVWPGAAGELIEGDMVATLLQVGTALLVGLPVANKGLRALLVGRQITIDLLMSIATLGALLIGETGEAATVMVLFAVGEALEGYTAERARRSLRGLLALKPEQAHVLRPCYDCAEHLGQDGYTGGACPFCGEHETTVPAGQVAVGERVLVRPGERIPLDGRVLAGASAVNQAPVTGESLPVPKTQGDEVFAGTLNGEGALEIETAHPAADSTIARIVRLVEQAQAQRAPVERFIDRFAAWYTPAVVLLAASLAILPPLLFKAPFFDLADGTRGWLYRALAMLIVACPCALVISTPVTVVSALTGLARRGVMVKGGAFLDVLARLRVFAFDKTGTLTGGKPVVRRTQTHGCISPQANCAACDDMLALAASVERRSQHPLAQAIVAEAEARGLLHTYPAAEAVRSLAGQGVRGTVNGQVVFVGSHSLFHQQYQHCNGLHEQVQAAEADGETVMLVGRGDTVIGFVSLADALRPTSQQALQALKAIDPRIHTVMLTGDNPAVAAQVAGNLGHIDTVQAGLMPEQKLGAVQALQAQSGGVAMVGDGVNDAPALAAAAVGIAMGGAGSAQAMETADVILMQDDLARLPDLVRTSRRTRQIILQNITFSLAIKAAFLILTLPGWATLWMAVFADMGASLLVTLNGLRAARTGGRG
jgi:Cd2+/Zn2+-exporting ATPase